MAFKCFLAICCTDLVREASRLEDQNHHHERPDLEFAEIRAFCTDLSPNVSLEQYDRDFYPWPGSHGKLKRSFLCFGPKPKSFGSRKRIYLPRHGLAEARMKVADICCGIGDFAILLYKHFEPS